MRLGFTIAAVSAGTVIALAALPSPVRAIKVDESELRKGKPVEFRNYPGRYTRILPRQEVRDIGIALGKMAKTPNQLWKLRTKYSVMRVVDPAEKDKLDADLFSIDRDSEIVDIIAIRIIVGAYLETQYGYPEADGLALATAVTYYNAASRGDLGFFGQFYKKAVIRNLPANIAGISRLWSDWPGRTRMVIPLVEGTNKRIDPHELTKKGLLDELKKKDDKGIDERDRLIELRKQEEKRKEEELRKQREENEKKQRELEKQRLEDEKNRKLLEDRKKEEDRKRDELKKREDDNKRETDENKKKLEEKRLAEEKKKLDEETAARKKQEDELKKKETDEAAAKKKLDEEKKKLEDKGKKLEDDKKETKKQDADLKKDADAAGKKTTDNTKLAEDLKKKEEELKKREEELKKKDTDRFVFQGTLYYLKIKDYVPDGHYANEMFLINPVEKKVILSSPFKNICGHRYDVYGAGVVVIGFGDNHDYSHFLVLLEPKGLTETARGKDNIYWKSFIEIRDGQVYAICKEGSEWRLGRFNEKLERVAVSDVPVNQDTFISIFGDFVYVSSPDKTILVLEKGTLKKSDQIKP